MPAIGSLVDSTNNLNTTMSWLVATIRIIIFTIPGNMSNTSIGLDQENKAPDNASETQSTGVPVVSKNHS